MFQGFRPEVLRVLGRSARSVEVKQVVLLQNDWLNVMIRPVEYGCATGRIWLCDWTNVVVRAQKRGINFSLFSSNFSLSLFCCTFAAHK